MFYVYLVHCYIIVSSGQHPGVQQVCYTLDNKLQSTAKRHCEDLLNSNRICAKNSVYFLFSLSFSVQKGACMWKSVKQLVPL